MGRGGFEPSSLRSLPAMLPHRLSVWIPATLMPPYRSLAVRTMARNIQIADAVERYLKERKPDVSESTLYNHSSQLNQFIEWCEADDERPTEVDDIDSWAVSQFKLDRREDLSDATIYNQMSVLRTFLKWCEGRDLMKNVSEGIVMPTVEDGARDTLLILMDIDT